MRIRFWGTRGSIAKAGPTTLRYGGNTSCLELRTDDGTLVVIDAGTGAHGLGQALLAEAGDRPLDGAIVIGHTHWDHIQGLPFFAPLFVPGGRWDVYGPRGVEGTLARTLAGQMEHVYFPVSMEQLAATIEYHDLVEGGFEIGPIGVSTHYLSHPALTLGYRFEADGATVVYAADHEPHDPLLAAGGDPAASRADAAHVEFLRGADVVVHDCQYLAAEYPERRGFGHSTVEYVVAVARAAGVGHLVLTHHDPLRDDAAVDALVAHARRIADRIGFAGRVSAAAEGETVAVTGRGPARTAGTRRAGPSACAAPALVALESDVVVSVEASPVKTVLRTAAAAEGMVVRGEVPAGASRALVFVDAGTPADRLAALAGRDPGVHVVAVGDPPAVPTDEQLPWPLSQGYVRTRLRAWRLRAACRWQPAPQPPGEADRLRSLRATGLLDSDPEERFDRYTRLACSLLDVPVALVTLVDGERQWFKSRHGTDLVETPRDESVCAHAILGTEPFQVPDLLADDRFADNPAVSGERRIRFYAGVPLALPDGTAAGTLCVVDHRPRVLAAEELARLRELAALVEVELAATPGSPGGPAAAADAPAQRAGW